MTSALLEPARAAADPRRERLRRRLGFAALTACLPYLALKALWVLGVDIGVVDRHRVSHGTWVLVNLVTFLMDATAALVAYLLTRPGGPRVRPWLLALPMWMASGLLSVIMLAVPLSTARVLFGAPNPFRDQDGFLDPWVYAVVYGGFIVEGAVLLTAYAMHAHDRHGPVLGAPVSALARRLPPVARAATAAAAALLATVGSVRLAWSSGAGFGLTAQRAAELAGQNGITEGVLAALTLAGAAGLLVLAAGRTRTRAWLPFAAAWVGSAAAFGWGGMIGNLGALARSADHPCTAFMIAVYIAETVAGLLVLGAGLGGLPAAAAGAARPTAATDQAR
ncbi:hypothetical protein ACFV1L_23065 [Kitasatospora sp. NPDC059646]|uniref:hypothetical protein n=1 Tax=Kitasatospora sp. NPDC059646 TaxID=3346893 RepID=UPI0036906BC6